jgi:4-aminobutyrate aminotransferase
VRLSRTLIYTQAVVEAAAKQHVLFATAGARETVRFLPPLVVSAAEIDTALTVFETVLSEVISSMK